METIESIMKDLLMEATNVVGNKSEYQKLLNEVKDSEKVKELSLSVKELPELIKFAEDYLKGVYTDVPVKTIIVIVSSLLYLSSKNDLIADAIPKYGIQDDKYVLDECIEAIKDEFQKYKNSIK